ncbi:MAG: hypothetical protein J5I94_10170 [Phaeodactylibacter sp.]|nr:hypothetical protein [Phaeodactylibacter sp.]
MKDTELIISFFTGKLKGQELASFRERLGKEPEFQALVRAYWPAFDGLNALRAEKFRQKLRQWEEELRGQKPEGLHPGFLSGEPSAPPGEGSEGAPEEIKDYQVLLEGLEGLRREKFEEQANAWSKELKTGQPLPERRPARVISLPGLVRYGIAAAILLAVSLTVIWQFILPGPENTYSAFRQEAYIPPSTAEMARGGDSGGVIRIAVINLESGQYPAALQALEQVAPADSFYLAALYLKGHAYYQMDRYTDARMRFDSLLAFSQREGYSLKGVNFENAAWARILAAVAQWQQEGQPDKETLAAMVEQFLETSNPEDTYHQEARRLRQLLEGP